ncbi:ABC transporter permease [Ferviditalea candida]|uniref:ABC transporter permease n=1 Tax=Ferviditalea candida TaxID=3108399 RepID=A0ABU5ZGK9_9BACL|nr:ABC transporter permease [Paenibacillaceae bacterium T2]
MISLYPLVKNETLKILRKKRFLVIILILAILIPVFTYARMTMAEAQRKQFGTTDWRVMVQQQIYDYTNRLGSARVPEEWKAWMRVQVQRLQYYLDHDVDPSSPNGVTFASGFMDNAVSLFIPLLVLAVASDLVSGERSAGTIKMLLTRPVSRWKILTSKLIALLLFTSLIVFSSAIMAYLISGVVFGYGGWDMPAFTGFQINGTQLNEANVHAVPQWQYLIMQSGLVWFSALVVACLSLMVSILVRSTAASIVIMMAAIIAGSILTNMAQSWQTAKYLFMVNLQLTDYLSGTLPPIPGMSLTFSLAVLSVWALASLIVSYGVFVRQDIL